jgi:hypothetical protein
MPHCYVVRSVDFSVARRTLIDLCGAGASTSGDKTSCTSGMGFMSAEIFLVFLKFLQVAPCSH